MPQTTLTEGQLRDQLAREGLTPTRWSNGPHAVYGLHDHPYRKRLVVVSGSITFTIETPPHREVLLQPGEWLDLSPRTLHRAVVGGAGVVCLESHVAPQSR